MFAQNVAGFNKTTWEKKVGHDRYRALLQEVIDLFVKKALTTARGQTFTLGQAKEAVAVVQKAAQGGNKVFLTG